jgi:hypothetical protein
MKLKNDCEEKITFMEPMHSTGVRVPKPKPKAKPANKRLQKEYQQLRELEIRKRLCELLEQKHILLKESSLLSGTNRYEQQRKHLHNLIEDLQKEINLIFEDEIF